ncbi:hypothetical protein L596_023818 [Steinernema carpocapsae]|uniref:Uncharacterized protein n=1 Tax=Steinernema carpocapsae TaxID=34508 RepID=A0A4U5MET0_STECR|nr:hypothetical protein L596_023818 [Steinernema carpocapsae]
MYAWALMVSGTGKKKVTKDSGDIPKRSTREKGRLSGYCLCRKVARTKKVFSKVPDMAWCNCAGSSCYFGDE